MIDAAKVQIKSQSPGICVHDASLLSVLAGGITGAGAFCVPSFELGYSLFYSLQKFRYNCGLPRLNKDSAHR